MTKRKTAIAAAAMAAASGNSVFVYASRKEDLPADDASLDKILATTSLSSFKCDACNTTMRALAGTEPFCITCGAGDGHVHQVEAKADTLVTAKTELSSMVCSTCNHVTVFEDSVINAIKASSKGDARIHCASCGTERVIKASEGDPQISDTPLMTPDAPKNPSDDFADPPAPTKAATVEASADDDIALDNLGDLDEIESSTVKASIDNDSLIVPDSPLEADMVIEPFSIEEDNDLDDLVDSPSAFTEELVEEGDFGFPEPEGDPLVDALEMDDTDIALAFVKANGRVIALKGHVAVASFSKASAGENYKLMNSEALPVAAKAAVASQGLRAGLQEVGFALVRVPVTSNAVVARKVQEIKASVADEEAKRKKEFTQIFALAAAGLNRGNWKGFTNPLRAAVETELSRLGAQQPKRIVSAIFEDAGVNYAKTLLEVSNRLSKLSASSRKEMAEMLDMTDVTASSQEDDDVQEETVESSNIEARFSRPALLRPKITASVDPESYASATAVLSGAAPLAFSSF